MTERPTSRSGRKLEHSDPVVSVWNGHRSKDKRYSGDNRLIIPWVQNVVRQFGLYLSWAQDICGDLTLVREDRVGRTPGLPVVPPGASPGS